MIDINDKNYYDFIGLSASQLKDYVKSPYEFWKRSVFNPNAVSKESKSMNFGSLAHLLLLEPQKFDEQYVVNSECFDMRTKAGKEWMAQQTKEVVSLKDYNKAKVMVDSLYNNSAMSALLKGITTEKPFSVDIGDGFILKGKVDAIKRLANNEIIIIDYKTTSEDLKSWSKYNTLSGHDIQVAVYMQLCYARYGQYPSHFLFLTHSTKDDYEDQFDVFEYDPASLDRAMDMVFGKDRQTNFIMDDNNKIVDKSEGNKKIDLIYNCKKDIYEYTHNINKNVFQYFDGNIKIMNNMAREYDVINN